MSALHDDYKPQSVSLVAPGGIAKYNAGTLSLKNGQLFYMIFSQQQELVEKQIRILIKLGRLIAKNHDILVQLCSFQAETESFLKSVFCVVCIVKLEPSGHP